MPRRSANVMLYVNGTQPVKFYFINAKVGIVWKNLGICLPEIWEEYKYTNIFHVSLPSWSIPE